MSAVGKRPRHSLRSGAVTFLLVAGIVLGTATAASAALQWTYGQFNDSNAVCAGGSNALGTGSGPTYATFRSSTTSYELNCSTTRYMAGSNQIRTGFGVWVHQGGSWAVCVAHANSGNPTGGYSVIRTVNYGNAPCGPGKNYTVTSTHEVQIWGSFWQTGALFGKTVRL